MKAANTKLVSSILRDASVKKAILSVVEASRNGTSTATPLEAVKKAVDIAIVLGLHREGDVIEEDIIPLDEIDIPDEPVFLINDYSEKGCVLVCDFRKPEFKPFKHHFLEGIKPAVARYSDRLSIPGGGWVLSSIQTRYQKLLDVLEYLGLKLEIVTLDEYNTLRESIPVTKTKTSTRTQPKLAQKPAAKVPSQPLKKVPAKPFTKLQAKPDPEYKNHVVHSSPFEGMDFVVCSLGTKLGTPVVGVQLRGVDAKLRSPLKTIRPLNEDEIAILKDNKVKWFTPDRLDEITDPKIRNALKSAYDI